MIPRRFIGIAVRDIIRTHLKAIAFVMFVLLVVAIAIDLTKFLDEVREKAERDAIAFVPLLLEYLLYRTADIVVRLLPMACLTGSFIAELLRHQRMEPVILSAAGASPGIVFAAMIGVGLILGGVQVALEGWLRPSAVHAQGKMEIGIYGHRFYLGNTGKHWFVEGDLAMEARVIRDDPPELQELRMFYGLGNVALSRIVEARIAVPTSDGRVWQLKDAVIWEGPPGAIMRPTQYEALDIELPFTAAHIRYHRIPEFNLPNADLARVNALKRESRVAETELAVIRRFTALFLPGVFAFLGASLAQCGRDGRMFAWWRLLVLGTFGYVTVVSVKSFWSLGEFGIISPMAAATLPMLFAFVVGALLQLWLNGPPERKPR